jgi:hypothetical protein
MRAQNAAPVTGITGRGHIDKGTPKIIRICRGCRYHGPQHPTDHGYCGKCAAGIRFHRALHGYLQAVRS